MKNKKTINLADGGGGREMGELIKFVRQQIPFVGRWKNTGDDAAVLDVGWGLDSRLRGNDRLVFTTDAFVVSPIFFLGGNIGDLAFNGTLNDLLMQGAKPLGISLSVVLEDGFLMADLQKILRTIGRLSEQTKVPIATGDTKVVEKGAVDKIMITTSGVGLTGRVLSDSGLKIGDKIIVSGTLGDHGGVLLAKRFNYVSKVKSDTKPLVEEMRAVGKYLVAAKDPTRGGLAAVMNEMAEKSGVKIVLEKNKIPIKKETVSICRLLGLSEYSIASEGRFVAGVRPDDAVKVLWILRRFNAGAAIVGEVQKGKNVFIKNELGEKKLDIPQGNLVPRIC
ncbi:MAG: hydrogenase expression/formation protein HypE [Patescibacteria group bacterium]